ncbi:hypothetical protein [Shinella sp.]|uniref:hypothetical protein n=1 Tax=Shinella sp. TaxID=1870904 RepID=UPI0025857AED|nr:hypothetical protein [Shinella sp.]MCW5711293.1 hypothetical protein [Shinella sp.]
MIRITDLIALVKAFTLLHSMAGMPMHPGYARTVATLLDLCERELLKLENAQASATPPVRAAEGNVIHVKFNRPTPPEGGAA